jgi:hypothetical protein
MRVVVCFFGITRNLEQHTLASIESHLLAPVARLDPQYVKLGHFNLPYTVINPRTGENEVLKDPREFERLRLDRADCTDQAQVDQALGFEEVRRFGDVWEDDSVSLRNLLRQLYSLNRVTDLLVESGKDFDLVIYSRADLRFESPARIPRIRPRTLYTPWFCKAGGLNDRFALGDQPTMVQYGRRGGWALRYCAETRRPLHSERFLAWYTRKLRLRAVDLTDVSFSRIRAHGSVAPWDIIVQQRLKHRLKHAFSRLKNAALWI